MTAPFPLSLLDKLKSRQQSANWKLILREVRQFRAYCCNIDSDGIMGVAKEPVPIVNLNPNPICLGEPMDRDISNSYAPGSTLTGWSIDFGDGTSEVGADFPNDTTSGTHIYTSAGTFNVVVNIEEGAGRDQSSTFDVIVVNCSESLAAWLYIATNGSGVWVRNMVTGEWIEKNGGLAGNALFVRSLVMKPSTKLLAQGSHVLWIATKDGIYSSENGGGWWNPKTLPDPSNLEFLDVPAATVDELDWHHIVFDPTDENIIYILASKNG